MEKDLKLLKDTTIAKIGNIQDATSLTNFYLRIFGTSGEYTKLVKNIRNLPPDQKPSVGKLANLIKQSLEEAFDNQKTEIGKSQLSDWLDVTAPGASPTLGHLHIVSQTIAEVTRIFEKIGFTRIRYPEIEWEWYSFEALNMPINHPARDDFETFFIDQPADPKLGKVVLSPHTSSGQVREMERVGKALPADRQAPIRMINITKCYRPNWDISHTPMFHQFEGLVVDKGINITHLKGTFEYFAKEFFGKNRKIRLRPFHFQFTEPSFEVDITCGFCSGKGCRLCKEGWMELCGSGMVHPNVLRAGKIDPKIYTGYAFGWGIERSYMMKQGLKIDDLRLLYSNDIRFLEQF